MSAPTLATPFTQHEQSIESGTGIAPAERRRGGRASCASLLLLVATSSVISVWSLQALLAIAG
ncbi:MAG TPA: hypothetical protein DCP75_16535 [Haliea salexigens]|uniref:Uncharacterized protein n=1 Tax=Haliea salexigens TaxID=287487 RepID=A0A3C1KS16_9GAMM|nr:hypothetical protein [Haliea salexigens]